MMALRERPFLWLSPLVPELLGIFYAVVIVLINYSRLILFTLLLLKHRQTNKKSLCLYSIWNRGSIAKYKSSNRSSTSRSWASTGSCTTTPSSWFFPPRSSVSNPGSWWRASTSKDSQILFSFFSSLSPVFSVSFW